jgi:hypothetical protein
MNNSLDGGGGDGIGNEMLNLSNVTDMSDLSNVTDMSDLSNVTSLTNLYFSMKSNNSEIADCSQNILMEEITVNLTHSN